MGYRCPVLLTLLGLAMAWGRAGLLPGQRATRNPTGLGFTQNGAPTDQPSSTTPDFRTHYRSHFRLNRGDRAFDIYLEAPDEKAEVLKASYCGGRAGARQFSGRYQLLAVADNTIVSRFDLGPDDTFVENSPHDGARLFHDLKSGQDLIALLQYGDCNSESVQFFSADPSGHLFLITFLDRDGRAWKQMLTWPNGVIPRMPDGSPAFCAYASSVGYEFCEAYAFDGENFLETAKWMTQDWAAPIKGRNDVGVAARTLFDFLSALSATEYAAAAFYLDPSATTGDAAHSNSDRTQRQAFLRNYCTVAGGQCPTPVKLEAKPDAGAPGLLRFQVSFQNSDFQPLTVGPRTSFDFRVVKSPKGFKVLDLPPRLAGDAR